MGGEGGGHTWSFREKLALALMLALVPFRKSWQSECQVCFRKNDIIFQNGYFLVTVFW